MEINLHGKVALVTGSGAGIGQAIAVALAGSGAFVCINYRKDEAGARETLSQVEQAGGKGFIYAADVSQAAQVEALMADIANRTGRLDILVNNAGGLVKRSKVADMSEDLWNEVMDINLKSTFLCCRAALPLMSGRGWGRIINISSVAAYDGGGAGATHYAATKGAVLTFTKGLAKEVAGEGITANCIAPGYIDTAFHKLTTAQAIQNMIHNTPLAREGRPSEVASAALFLASEMASFITGETIHVNGGLRME